MRIENLEGKILANYTSEYLDFFRKIYNQKKNKQESWIFTEKGLFIMTRETNKHFNWDSEKIYAYYRSDEALKDLQSLAEVVTSNR